MSTIGQYWAVVSVNLVNRRAEAAEFNSWYDRLHVPEFVARPGFVHGWRTRHIPHAGQRGNDPQEYSAIYEVDRIEDFVAALDASPSAGHSWGEWQGRVSDWTRTFYQIAHREPLKGRARGRIWVVIQSELERSVRNQSTKFLDWYRSVHVPEVCEQAQVYQAWLMKVVTHASQLGTPDNAYLAVYEVDSPERFLKARETIVPWGGVWEPKLAMWRRSFHDLLLDYPRE